MSALGLSLWIAYYTQTVGLKYTTSSKSAFITGLYIVFTPILALAVIKEKVSKNLFIALVLALAGLFVISNVSLDEIQFNKGDLITIASAFAFSIQIVLTNIYVKDIDMKLITSSQMIIMCVLSFYFLGAKLTLNLPVCIYAMLAFLGGIASFLAIFVETYSLKYIDPDRASIIFTLEPIFAYVSSVLFLGERITTKGLVGSSLIVVAMLISTTKTSQ